ncbi:riboflavin synthase [Butyrivibrio sp. DSM 10294]|uniref:riboflavin synthase n=1 Tax=Butyrivibrio sp. DSM 10294 TaxID=2972457 RepID=UPI00234FA2F2|nr:riboflavin synthase [Butyrivibrio sp. DSM 10294]MDC7293022.1 riboflavin synthase [Butyrivibrio sp. DSM 10294]
MFTGIIEEIGRVKAISRNSANSRLTIEAKKVLEDVRIGDSIAVNGVCLTVVSFDAVSFTVDVMNETYSRSSLGELRSDSSVNLERAMAAGGRFGGHMVSGHIDGTGRIKATRRDGNAVWYEITAEHALLEGIVEKGSITIDGISLTVAKVTTSSFSVSIIPHTLEQTILKDKRPGSVVNLETDMIGKYVRAFLSQSGEKRDFWEVMYG